MDRNEAFEAGKMDSHTFKNAVHVKVCVGQVFAWDCSGSKHQGELAFKSMISQSTFK